MVKMLFNFFFIPVCIFLNVTLSFSAEIAADTDIIPTISWRADIHVDEYVPLYIEPQNDIANDEPFSPFIYKFENNTAFDLVLESRRIHILKQTRDEQGNINWIMLPNEEAEANPQTYVSGLTYINPLTFRIRSGESIRLRMDINDYDFMYGADEPTGQYAIAAFCYDYYGRIVVGTADFCIDNNNLITTYEHIDSANVFYSDPTDENLVKRELAVTEYPPSYFQDNNGIHVSYTNLTNDLQNYARYATLLKYIHGEWHEVPLIYRSRAIIDLPGGIEPGEQWNYLIRFDRYGHEFTDGRYALLFRNYKNEDRLLEFKVNSAIDAPR